MPPFELQAICKIKELRTSNFQLGNINEAVINELNDLLSKGWVLLKIYTTIASQPADDNNSRIVGETLNYVLGLPHSGFSYIADQHRSEFDR
jgi:intein-encoded DNA endonuclease-like protein